MKMTFDMSGFLQILPVTKQSSVKSRYLHAEHKFPCQRRLCEECSVAGQRRR